MSAASGPDRTDAVRSRGRRRTGRTSRRLRTAERRRRRLRRFLVTGGVLTVLLALAVTVAVRDVMVVRDALRAAESELRRLPAAIDARDVPAAVRATTTASSALFPAEQRVGTWRWRTAAAVPRLGAPLALVAELTGTVRIGLDVAEVLTTDEVLAGLTPEVADGQIDLAPLVRLSDALSRAPLERLADALVRLETADTTLAPAVVLDARADALRLLRPAGGTLGRARDLTAGLPVFLGADGPRRHLVVVQTSSELRGTGGLIGLLAVLEADEGRLRVSAPRTFDPVATDGTDPATIDPAATPDPATTDPAATTQPPGRPATDDVVLQSLPGGARPVLTAEYDARYRHVDPGGSLSNVNVDPDVPTSGEVLLDLYELRTGLRLDGVVFLDPIGLATLLGATDTVLTLPPALIAGTDAPATLAPEELAAFVLADVYEDFGATRNAQRDALFAVLAVQALDAVFTTPWDGTRMAEAVVEAGAGRHLQVHARDVVVASALRTTPAGGRFADDLVTPATDVLAVTVNNAVGGKQDVHVAHATTISVELGDPAAAGAVRRVTGADGRSLRVRELARRVSVRTEITNPLTPGAFDLYVTGNCRVGTPTQGCFLGPEADHRAWLTFWLGAGDVPWAVRDADGYPPVRVGHFHGVTTIDRHLEVLSRRSGWVEVVTDGTTDVELDEDGTLVYRLRWWRHAKAIHDRLDVTVTAPDGWEVVDVTLTGGDGGESGDAGSSSRGGAAGAPTTSRLLGPDRDRAPITLLPDPDRAHASGTVERDVTLTVRLRPVSG